MKLLFLWLSLMVAGAALAKQQNPPAGSEDPIKAQQERSVTQPGNNAPVWREVRRGDSGPYTTTTPRGRETEGLGPCWGDTWRRLPNGPMMFFGGWVLGVAAPAALGLYSL